eukprot:m.26380 g.26380  ORF g.26380 m.26380 type:complete len:247 (+) comp5853_c0_seq1:162-902(+)
MSAKDLMRQQLAELMGTEAMGLGSGVTETSDSRNCHYFVAGLCPHDLFSNTKKDLGPCQKEHIQAMQDKYAEELKEGKSLRYEDELYDVLSEMMETADMAIVQKQKRLEEESPLDREAAIKMSQVQALIEEIGKKLVEAESFGEDGKVEESLKVMKELEELKERRKELETELNSTASVQLLQHQQRLQICDVCGCHLSTQDNDRRFVSQHTLLLFCLFISPCIFPLPLLDSVSSPFSTLVYDYLTV